MRKVGMIQLGFALILLPAIPFAAILDGMYFGVISVEGYIVTCIIEYVLFLVAFGAGIVVQDQWGKDLGETT